MSKNINQVFMSNPATAMEDDDLMYLGRSPYGLTNDMAILWSDIVLSLGNRFLERANNLSDLNDQLTAYQNFGMGARSQVTYTDVDFPVVLTNPCPNIITLDCSSPGNVLQLPDAQGSQSFELFNGPEIINIGSERVDIVSFLGIPQTPSQPNSDFDYLLTDKGTHGGLWDARGHINTINGTTGNVVFTSNDGSVTITPDTTIQTVDLSVAGSEGFVYQQLYVNDAFGDDSNSGSILQPMKTYEAARLKAVSLSPSISNPFVINMIGRFSITGDMTITPFVSVFGTSDYSSIITLTGNIVLDNAWNSTSSPFSIVGSLNILTSGGISLTYTTFQSGSFIRFQNCSLQVASIVANGAGTNTSCERVIFNNCNTDGFTEPTFTVDNVDLFLFNTNPSNNMDVSVTSSTSQANFILTSAQSRTGNITLNAAASGTLTTILGSSNTYGKTLTINGSSNTVNIDSTSYQFTLSLNGGATLSNLVLPTKTDGLVNTSYTPINYTPTAGTNFSSNTLTGNLKGIDDALGLISSVDPSQLIFLDANSGDDTNPGTISKPLKTYEAANILALSRNPHYGSGQTIVIMSSVQTVADLVLIPYVDIFGFGMDNSIIGVTNSISLHSSWGTISIPTAQIMNIGFVASNINFLYPSFQDASIIRFQNCGIQLLDMGAPATITGSNGSGNAFAETIIFDKCNLDISNRTPEPAYNGTDVNMFFWDTNLSSSVTSSVTSSTIHAKLLIQNAPSLTGNITVNATSSGTLTTQITGCNPLGSTLNVNGTSNGVSIDASSNNFSSYVFSGGATFSNINTGSLLVIYVDQVNGNDSNSGTINYPLQNYETARLLAISRGASFTTPCEIIIIGTQNITGEFTISPFVNVMGLSQYNTSIFFTTTVQLSSEWGTTSTPMCEVKDLYIFSNTGGTYSLTYPAYQTGSFIRFQNCGFNTGSPFTITGSGLSAGNGVEQVIFDNCTNDSPGYTLDYTLQDVDAYFINNDLSNSSLTHTVASANSNCLLFITNCQYYSGNIHLVTSSTSTLNTWITGTNTNGYTLTIDGNLNTVNVDSTSYMFTLVLAGGATLSNLVVPTKTDGMVNTSYSPLNYVPVGDTLYGDNTLTANLKGIDNALPKASGSVMLSGGTATVSSSVVANGDSIQLTMTAAGGTPGFPVITYNPGVSFTITSTSALDTSTYKWKNLGA